nr:hypothetical protein [Tanacetum cinerariifolium]
MIKRNLLVMGLAVLLSACGFQLRGTGTNALSIKELDVSARDAYGEVVTQLRQTLTNSGVHVYTGAQYKLFLAREDETQRTASYVGSGRSAEYELTTVLKYEIQGSKGVPLLNDNVQSTKIFVHDGNNLIGSDQEADQIRKEVRSDLVQKMLARLQQLTPERLDELQAKADAAARAQADAEAAAQRVRDETPQQSPVEIPTNGDDPLQCQEACDAIRAAARQQGFDERQVFSADSSFDWGTLLQAGASMSLFAERRLLELRLPSGKPGDKGAQTQFVQIWPVDASQLPQWIRQRLSQAGLAASPDAVELIAARVEGNLLAAAQEIEKLKLMAEQGQITVETVQAAVADSARFDVFGLTDAILNGEAAHALRMLEGLRGEGVEPPVILWALSRELRVLANLALQYSQGVPLDKAFSQARPPIWDKRKPLMSKALQRHSARRWAQLLMDAQHIDAQIKG